MLRPTKKPQESNEELRADLKLSAERAGLSLEAKKELRIQVQAEAGAAKPEALSVLPTQADLLQASECKLVAIWPQGEIAVPAGLLSKEKRMEISLQRVPNESLRNMAADMRPIAAFEVEIVVLADGERIPLDRLSGKIDMLLRYDSESIYAHQMGVSHWDRTASAWNQVQAAVPQKDGVALSTDRLGVYAIMESIVRYSDMDGLSDEARHAIETLTAMRVIEGTGGGRFWPGKAVTRAEFAAMLVRALDLDLVSPATGPFTDIDAKAWYASAVNTAWQAGINQGDGSRFFPNEKVTREQMAAMLVKAQPSEKHADREDSLFADDGEISAWAKKAVYRAKANGWIQGVGGNAFSPKANASRADAAVVLLRWQERS